MKGAELRACVWRAQGREGRGTRSLLGVEQSDSSHCTFSPESRQGRGHSGHSGESGALCSFFGSQKGGT